MFNFRCTRMCFPLPDIPWQSRTSKVLLTLDEQKIIKEEGRFRNAYAIFPGRISSNHAEGLTYV